jgi:prepilin-type N-terminal cleavage/methylation domain-containing protein
VSSRRGVTLIEMLVSLAILAILLGLAGLHLPARTTETNRDEWRVIVKEAERKAMRSGRPVTVSMLRHDRRWSLTVTEDGTVVMDSALSAANGAIDSALSPSR